MKNPDDIAFFEKTAVKIANRAGEELLLRMPNNSSGSRKAAADAADHLVHDLIMQHLVKTFDDHGIVSAFTDNQSISRSGVIWVIDPLVGLGNFAHSHPDYTVSLACVIEGVPQIGVVNIPATDQLYVARRGQGATMNGKPIHVSSVGTLLDSLLSTRFPYDLSVHGSRQLKVFTQLIHKVDSIHHNANATLDLVLVASGKYDGFWSQGMNPWDLIAANLIVAEAGGQVTDLNGSPGSIQSRDVIATNGRIHSELVDCYKTYSKEFDELSHLKS